MRAADYAGPSLVGRARLRPAGEGGRLELALDGWPLVTIGVEEGQVLVHDQRGDRHDHVVGVGAIGDDQVLRLGAVGDELYLLVGEVATVFVTPQGEPSTHADVAVVASATGRLLLERGVRYRPAPNSATSRRLPRPTPEGDRAFGDANDERTEQP